MSLFPSALTSTILRGAMKHAAWVAILLALPAFAQLDLTGIWSPVFHEDQPERIP